MPRPTIPYPLKDRRKFALWAHAATCFQNCADACDYVLEHQLTQYDRLYKPLTVCAVIEYSKPFTNNKTLGSTPKDIISEGNMKLHKDIMSLRNKVMAHLDTRGLANEVLTHHCVRFEVVRDGRYERYGYIVEEPKIAPETVPELLSLAKVLAEKAHYHASRHIKKLTQALKRARTGHGEYLVELEETATGLVKLTEAEKAALFWD